MKTLLAIIQIFLVTANVANAAQVPSDVSMSFSGLSSEVAHAFPDGKNLPSDYSKLPREVRGALNSHLRLIAKAAKASGVQLEIKNGRANVLGDERTALGKMVAFLKREGVKEIVYDPLYLANYAVVGAFDAEKIRIFATMASVATAEIDSTFHHESTHAQNFLRVDRVNSDVRLTFQSKGNRDLRKGALIYPRYLNADELSAYVEELKFMLSDSTSINEVNEASGLTPFEDKLSLFREVILTLISVTENAESKNFKLSISAEKIVAHFDNFDVEIVDCKAACSRNTPEVWKNEVKIRLARLSQRSLKIEAILKEAVTNPSNLVDKLSVELNRK